MAKLRISTANRSAVFQFEEEKLADWHFSQLLRMLTNYLDEEFENEEEEKEDTDSSSEIDNESLSEVCQDIASEETLPEESQCLADDEKITEVKGFVYMKCPNCGNIHGTNLKKWQSYFRCKECGELIAFRNLRTIHVNCECGESFYYKTNLKIPMFDIPCLACGNPVAVYYNEKKESYQTIDVRR